MRLNKFLIRRNSLVEEIKRLKEQRAGLVKGSSSRPARKMLSYRIAKAQRALLRLDLNYGPLEFLMRAKKIARRNHGAFGKLRKPKRPV